MVRLPARRLLARLETNVGTASFLRVRALGRGLAVVAFATAVAVLPPSNSIAAAERTFDVSGTVIEVRGPVLVILTADVIGTEQPITVDVSQLRGLQIQAGDPLSLTVMSREFNTYLATGIVDESPFVNRLEFGVREEFTTKQDSIEARVGNVPHDDEALAKQHRDRKLRQQEDDDDDERRRRR